MLTGTLMSEYGYSFFEAVAEDYCRALALIAVICERNGMIGKATYRTHDQLAWLEENKHLFEQPKDGKSIGFVF